jgi:hypothetical protein
VRFAALFERDAACGNEIGSALGSAGLLEVGRDRCGGCEQLGHLCAADGAGLLKHLAELDDAARKPVRSVSNILPVRESLKVIFTYVVIVHAGFTSSCYA